MKKTLTILAFALLCTLPSFAQSRDYKDLLGLFVDEKYEKVLYKAEGYTLDDKTKKDALPYLFMSMSYFEMSKLDKYKEKYPNAFKDALKYVSKYAGKDKTREYASEYEDFFSEIRAAAIAEAEIMMDQEKYTKAKSMYNYLIDIDPNDAGAHLMLGIAFAAMKSKKESATSIETGINLLKEKTCSVSNKEQRALLKSAILLYAESLNEAGEKETAVTLLDLGMEYFKDDKEYQVTYELIAG